jgi:transcriptional regulator with XRE-family HTH domain
MDQPEARQVTGLTIKYLRKRLGLSLADMGHAMGYEGNRATLARRLRRIEARDLRVTDRAAAAVQHLADAHGIKLG